MGLMNWVRSGGWIRSPFGDLPTLRADDAAAHQTWLILLGGIALVLSRASKAELQTRFSAAYKLYVFSRARLQKRRQPKPDPRLLRDALSEIANLADPMTQEAGRECLERCLERLGQKMKVAPEPLALAPTSSLTSSQAAASRSASTAGPDSQATQIDLDLVFERSNKLRHTVAFARSTTFGQDS